MPRLQVFVVVVTTVCCLLCLVNLLRGSERVLLSLAHDNAESSASASSLSSSLVLRHLLALNHHDSTHPQNTDREKDDDNIRRLQQQQANARQPQAGDSFAPGTLALTRWETLAKCYVDPLRYKQHLQKPLTCATSAQYNVTFHLLPKSASSTGRLVMKEHFHATEHPCPRNDEDNKDDGRISRLHYTIVRNPYARFFASFDEMFLRYISRRRIKRKFKLPTQYSRALQPFRDTPYYAKIAANRILAAFVQFVKDYDAAIPFDVHLRLQVPSLANATTGRTVSYLDALLDTETLNHHHHHHNHHPTQQQQGWAWLAATVGHNVTPPSTVARANARRFNTSRVPINVLRKICQLQALDFCCLNYALPDPCRDVVSCQWTTVTTMSDHDTQQQQQQQQSPELVIQALSPYPPYPNTTTTTMQTGAKTTTTTTTNP